MLRRSGFASIAAWLLVAACALGLGPLRDAHAQSGRVFRIGFLVVPSEDAVGPLKEAFTRGLAEHGYVVGRNVRIDYRFADYDVDRLPRLAAELVQLEPDVIVTASPAGVRAASDATRRIPIVIGAVYDPVGLGFVKSLARPGGNITGVSLQYEDTVPKLLELVTTVIPKARKLAILRTVDRSHDAFVERIGRLGNPLQIRIESFLARTPSDIAPAFAAIGASHSDAVLVLPHPLFNTRTKEVVDAALASRMPGIFPLSTYAEAGGLMSLGVALTETFYRAAYHVHRILQGASPAELPVEQPNRIDLVVNLRTARMLGINVPPSIVLRADRVIQ